MFVLGVIAVLALVLFPFVAVFIAVRFSRRISELQQRLALQEREILELKRWITTGATPVAPEPRPVPATVPVTAGAIPAVAAEASVPSAPAAIPSKPIDLESLLGGQWMSWLGILAIFFGTAFFLAYDLGGHPLGGTGQVLVGLAIGASFIAAGRSFASRVGRYLELGLLGGGVGLLYLSAYASHAFHHLVPGLVVFPFLFGVAIVGTMLALREDSRMVVSLTQAGALLTPFFLPLARGESPGAFFIYLASVAAGSFLVARRRPWPFLPISGFSGIVLLVLWWWFRNYSLDVRPVAAFGLTILWLLFAVAPFTVTFSSREWGVAWSTVVVANGFLFELALYALLAPEFHTVRGLATAILSLLYVVGARQAAGRSKSREAVRLTRLTGLGMAALAIPIQFDLQWVTLGWSLLALVLLDSGFSASALGERLLAYAVLLLAVLHAFLFDTVQAFADLDVYRPWVNGTFLVGAAAAGALGLAARALSRNRHVITPFERRLVTPLILMSAIVLLLRVLVEVVAGFELRERLTGAELYLPMLLTVTLVWTVYSGLLILGGFMFRYRPIRFLGIASLAFLLFKVFAFDLQELERGYRIASFAGVGLLLLLISILYQRERRTA